MDPTQLYGTAALELYVLELIPALDKHARKGGTAEGAAIIAWRIARRHGSQTAALMPQPRLTPMVRQKLVAEGKLRPSATEAERATQPSDTRTPDADALHRRRLAWIRRQQRLGHLDDE